MGRNKLLLQVAGQSLLRRAVTTAVDAGLDPVLVVLGHESERARPELKDLRCEVVLNAGFEEGIHSSVRMGIAAVPAGCAAAVVLLADMPLVEPEMVRTLVRRYRDERPLLVVSDYEGVDAPPILYDRALFAELRDLEGEGCGKRVVKRHSGEAVRIHWPARALTDLDRPEDVERVRGELGGVR
jgi:molybdenum cofactor cytidylyltransferase